jgi:hypothetical protein
MHTPGISVSEKLENAVMRSALSREALLFSGGKVGQ